MKRNLLLVVLGAIVGTLLYRLAFPPETALDRCRLLYANNPLLNDNNPEIQDVLANEGLDTVDELITRRCSTWIKNGQKF
jgi:hypothetical protein